MHWHVSSMQPLSTLASAHCAMLKVALQTLTCCAAQISWSVLLSYMTSISRKGSKGLCVTLQRQIHLLTTQTQLATFVAYDVAQDFRLGCFWSKEWQLLL